MSIGNGKESLTNEIARILFHTISKAEQEKLNFFENFINDSVNNANFNQTFNLSKILKNNAQRLKMILDDKGQKRQFNLDGYILSINSNEIRHIKNNHPKDLDLLYNLYDIYHNFDKVQWNLIKNKTTGKPIIAISFFKHYKDGIAKAVTIYTNNTKELKLKTLFRLK